MTKDMMGRFVGLAPISNALAGVFADINVTAMFVGAGLLLTISALTAAANFDKIEIELSKSPA